MAENEALLFQIKTIDRLSLRRFLVSTRDDPGVDAEVTQQCLIADTPACPERQCNRCSHARRDHRILISMCEVYGFSYPDPRNKVRPQRTAQALDTVIYESAETMYEEDSAAIKVSHEKGAISVRYP